MCFENQTAADVQLLAYPLETKGEKLSDNSSNMSSRACPEVFNVRMMARTNWRVNTYFNALQAHFGVFSRNLRELGSLQSMVSCNVALTIDGDVSTSTMNSNGRLRHEAPTAVGVATNSISPSGGAMLDFLHYAGKSFYQLADAMFRSNGTRAPITLTMSIQIDGNDYEGGVATATNLSLSANPWGQRVLAGPLSLGHVPGHDDMPFPPADNPGPSAPADDDSSLDGSHWSVPGRDVVMVEPTDANRTCAEPDIIFLPISPGATERFFSNCNPNRGL